MHSGQRAGGSASKLESWSAQSVSLAQQQCSGLTCTRGYAVVHSGEYYLVVRGLVHQAATDDLYLPVTTNYCVALLSRESKHLRRARARSARGGEKTRHAPMLAPGPRSFLRFLRCRVSRLMDQFSVWMKLFIQKICILHVETRQFPIIFGLSGRNQNRGVADKRDLDRQKSSTHENFTSHLRSQRHGNKIGGCRGQNWSSI